MTIPYTIPWERDIHTRVSVSRADGFTWVDLLPFVSSVDVSSGTVTRFGGKISGIDGVMPQLDLVLRQDRDNVLNPQDQNSTWNRMSGQYRPLLAPMREIFIATAITPPGVQPSSSDWIGLFHGYLGDGIRVENDIVRLTCRSLSKRLQETYIEEPKDYGSEGGTLLEQVLQDVLDDNGLNDVILYCPEPTGFMVETYSAENVQYKTVWDVLQALATAHGFFLGDLWDPITESMRLTLLVPPRDKDINTADFVLNYRSDFLREEREIRDTAVRNVIIGHFWDKTTNEKRTITVKDDLSIVKFGRRAMEVSEEATSLIQTESEMITFLNAILSDLKDQQGTSYLSMPFFPQIGLFSGLVIHHPAMSSTDDFMGVESYRHRLDFEAKEYRTEIVGSGRIRGGQQRWLKSETKPGSPSYPNTPPTSNVPPPNVKWGPCSFIADVNLNWEPVRGAAAYEIRADDNWGYSDGIVYRGNGLSYRFPPTQREYTLYIRAINQVGLYSEQATPIILTLPVPAAPDQPTIAAYFNALKIHPTPLNSPAVMGYFVYVVNGEVTEKKPVMAGGDLTYPAKSGTTVTIQVSAYDVLGEGPKSEPLQATTTHLSEMDLPKIPKNKLEQSLQDEIDIIPTLESGYQDLVNKITPLIVLSNESQSFITEYDGSITEQVTLRTEIEVFLGKIRTAASIGSLTVRKLDGTILGGASPTKGNPSASAVGFVQWVIPVGATVDADAGYIEIPITVEDVTYTKRFMWNKAKKGQTGTGVGEKGDPGEPAKLVNIIASHLYFVAEDVGEGGERVRVYTPDIISLDLSLQHATYNKWQYSLDGSAFADVVSGQHGLTIDPSTKSLSIASASSLFGPNQVSITFRVVTTTGQYDQATISRIYNSESLATEIRQTDDAVQIIADDLSAQGAKIGSLEVRADGVDISVGSLEADVGAAAAQILTLAEQITIKVQKTVNGELVVTGIGAGFDEQGQSLIPVLADRFVIKPTVQGEGEYAFMVDTTKNPPEIYSPGKMILGGLLRAPELQAELIKVLLLKAELAYLDEANVLHLRAEKITVGGGYEGIPVNKPKDSYLWHFDTNLNTTGGQAPEPGGSASIISGGVYGGAVELGTGNTLIYKVPSSNRVTIGAHIQIKE